MTDAERWLPVPDFPLFEVSSHGRIRRVDNNKILTGTRHDGVYYRVELHKGCRTTRYSRYVHRLVCHAFHGDPPPGTICLHGNDDPADNHASNLRWGTPRENATDRERNKKEHLMPKGRGCKAKGDTYERELAEHFSKALNLNVRRTPLSGAFSMVKGYGSADLTGLPNLWPEAKRTERVAVHEAMAQAKRGVAALNSPDMPVVITRRNRQSIEESLCILELKDFITLYRAYLQVLGYQTTVSPSDPLRGSPATR